MYLIAGLGNPGAEYEETRHNAGFWTVDRLAADLGVKFSKIRNKALYAEAFINGEKCLILKPVTFMNGSGEPIAAFARFYGVEADKIVVVFDDTAIVPGEIRVRKEGSAGGHNGMKDVILRLNSDAFPRVRVGVGAKPVGWVLRDFVLSKFNSEDKEKVQTAVINAAEAVRLIVSENVEKAMNKYNVRMKAPPKTEE